MRELPVHVKPAAHLYGATQRLKRKIGKFIMGTWTRGAGVVCLLGFFCKKGNNGIIIARR